MMKAWVTGEQNSAAKIDPTIATILIAVVDVLVRTGVADKIGMTPDQLLTTLLDLAFIVLMARSIQINVKGRGKGKGKGKGKKTGTTDSPPSADPPPADLPDTAA